MDPYSKLDDENSKLGQALKQRSDLKKIFYDFLGDFKYYLTEFTKESLIETSIGEIPVSTQPTKLFDGEFGGMHLVLKNQGQIECYLNTNGQGGFCLKPGEKERLWLNKPLTVVTISGSTVLGLIRT